nr:uncharacterized protein LOC111428728 [Onthophagus taurus]
MSMNERVARSVALEQAYVHDVYEQFCDNPKSKPWPRVQQFLESLEPGSLVCDVGCGNGKYLNVNNAIFNIGGEKCCRLSEVAKEKDNEVLVLDNLALPFRDESLDAVLSVAVVHHFATTERRVCALRELARVLKIGGRLIISVWAMEQSHRKFESQDVLVPWHRPQHLSTPSLELTSTTTTSEDDCTNPYHAYTQSDTDSNKSGRTSTKKKGRTRHKGRSIDPKRNSSPSSSSLSSPNETCYSFVRRAIQKLAGTSKRVGVHRPWFLDSWTTCTKDVPPPKRYDPDGCECCDCDIQDIPIELRRVDDDELPQRRQTFPSSQIFNDLYNNLKSRSMTNIKTVENNNIIRSQSGVPSIADTTTQENKTTPSTTLTKPKLVKQKKSICEEDEEALDKPTEMKQVNCHLPEGKIVNPRSRLNVLKQRSLNEDVMSTERLREKEKLRQNIQKQASLNEDLIYQGHHAFDSFKDSILSVTTAKRLQLFKTGFTKKIKNSTTNIEKVTGTSLKNGFVRMFQNWTSSELISPTIPEDDSLITSKTVIVVEEKREPTTERRHSKEDGSDSSKDSSLQSDTSVDSEDSFASVIFIPKSDPMSPSLSPGPTSPRVNNSSVPNSPRIKQSSCPTSPRIKQMPLSIYPLTKQLSSPKPTTTVGKFPEVQSPTEEKIKVPTIVPKKKNTESLAKKYSVQQIPKFKKTPLNTKQKSPEKSPEIKIKIDEDEVDEVEKEECLKEIRDLLSKKPGFGVKAQRSHNFPIVRRCSVNNGKVQSIAKPLPKLLSLELFNPETDDKDSDSSAVSSPDSIDSVISADKTKNRSKFTFNEVKHRNNLLEAAADVANSLDEAVEKVIKSSPRARRREVKTGEVISVMQRQYPSETVPLLTDIDASWNEDCHKHLTDFADKLSEKLLKEIDQYQQLGRKDFGTDHLDDPYIHRLSEELNDLSKLSAEIQKQNEYLAKLSVSDSKFADNSCSRCKLLTCTCNKIVNKDSGGLKNAVIKTETSIESYDSDKGSSPNSIVSMSRYSDGGSTASLASCPEWKRRSPIPMVKEQHQNGLYSDTSQESLPSDNVGGEITYHRYYHVFREGELDQLIEKYVENLHIISSYYDHASWCIVAEKVQVWTI